MLADMITTYVWDGNLQLTAECDHHKCDTASFGAIWEISIPGKKRWPELDKSNGKTLSEGRERFLYIVSGSL